MSRRKTLFPPPAITLYLTPPSHLHHQRPHTLPTHHQPDGGGHVVEETWRHLSNHNARGRSSVVRGGRCRRSKRTGLPKVLHLPPHCNFLTNLSGGEKSATTARSLRAFPAFLYSFNTFVTDEKASRNNGLIQPTAARRVLRIPVHKFSWEGISEKATVNIRILLL